MCIYFVGFQILNDFTVNRNAYLTSECVLIWSDMTETQKKHKTITVFACLSSGEAKDDRQAGGHQFAPEGWDGPLQEDDGQTETEQAPVPERKGSHARGGRFYFMQSDTCT